MIMTNLFKAAAVTALISIFWSCTEDVTVPDDGIRPSGSAVKGFYLLNEGSWGHNNATLDYFDLSSGTYTRDCFSTANPDLEYGLGDVGNDIFISGDLLFIIMNSSNIVEIASASDARHIAEVPVPNCRYGTVADGFLYVTSYADDGTLYKISLDGYKIEGTLKVGYEPEQLHYHDGFIYVLNSGGYHAPDYDDTITVVDTETFTVEKTVQTGFRNLSKIICMGDVEYITSAGDYGEDPGAVFSYDPASGEISLIHGQSVSNWCLSGNIIYTQSVTYDESWNAGTSFGTIKDAVFSDSDFLDLEGISLKSCYGLAANPETGELVVCDAGDYKAEGSVYYFNADGSLSWSHTAGVCPSKVCWVYSE